MDGLHFITGLLANLSIWWYTQEKAFPVSFAIQGRFLAPQTTLSLFPTGSVHRVFSLTFTVFTGLDFIK